MNQSLYRILFGRNKSWFVKFAITLVGLYIGVFFWYFDVMHLGHPIQNTLVVTVGSLTNISILLALYQIPEQLCLNPQIQKLLYFPVKPSTIIYTVILRLLKMQVGLFICCLLPSIYFFKWHGGLLLLAMILYVLMVVIMDLLIFSMSVLVSTVSKKYCGYLLLTFQYGGYLFIMREIARLLILSLENSMMISGIYFFIERQYLVCVIILIAITVLCFLLVFKISESFYLKGYRYLNGFTKPSFHINLSKYFKHNPYLFNEWCRVVRNKELLFYSSLKSAITIYFLVRLISKTILGSVIDIVVMVLCCAMNTISSTAYSSDKNTPYYSLYPIKEGKIFFSKVWISTAFNELVIICIWLVSGRSEVIFLLYGTITNVLCSLMGVYFDYNMPRVEGTSNTLWHGNMSKLYVFIFIVLITILELYIIQTLHIEKLPIALSMMNSMILLLIGLAIYMKRGRFDDRNE